MSKAFIEWLAELIEVYKPADFAYPEVMAETIYEEMREAGWKVVGVK